MTLRFQAVLELRFTDTDAPLGSASGSTWVVDRISSVSIEMRD